VTKADHRRAIERAACLAVLLHLALFLAIRPVSGSRAPEALTPPGTYYLAKASAALPSNGADARTVWSPLLFSLPSEAGFSHDLLQEMPRTPSTYFPQAELEDFLEADPVPRGTAAQVQPQELMLTTFGNTAPKLPASEFQSMRKHPAARRVYVVPELKERLVGGIILPPELNKEVDAAWEAHASVHISRQGVVRHIFLDQPLESAELNGQVLQMLYGLRFKPGEVPVDGRIEIYSPKPTGDSGVQP
jgi:hypothetical protein